MAQELSTEDRLALLESRVAELEQQRRVQEDRDIALLARIDTFIDDLHRVERVQMRGFEDLKLGQKELERGQKNLEQALGVVVDAVKNHKESIEVLAGQLNDLSAGQQQILLLLTGKPPRND